MPIQNNANHGVNSHYDNHEPAASNAPAAREERGSGQSWLARKLGDMISKSALDQSHKLLDSLPFAKRLSGAEGAGAAESQAPGTRPGARLAGTVLEPLVQHALSAITKGVTEALHAFAQSMEEHLRDRTGGNNTPVQHSQTGGTSHSDPANMEERPGGTAGENHTPLHHPRARSSSQSRVANLERQAEERDHSPVQRHSTAPRTVNERPEPSAGAAHAGEHDVAAESTQSDPRLRRRPGDAPFRPTPKPTLTPTPAHAHTHAHTHTPPPAPAPRPQHQVRFEDTSDSDSDISEHEDSDGYESDDERRDDIGRNRPMLPERKPDSSLQPGLDAGKNDAKSNMYATDEAKNETDNAKVDTNFRDAGRNQATSISRS